MCKYCKKLIEIKDLEEKSYQKTIDNWKRRDKKARDLLIQLLGLTKGMISIHYTTEHSLATLEYEVLDFVNSNWIGK